MEAAVALTFLWPLGRGPSRLRDATLLVFCALTYAVATVEGFAWLLLAMGLAQTTGDGWRRAYVGVFFLTVPLLFIIGRLTDLPLVGVTGLFALLYFMNQPVGNAMIPSYTAPGSRGMAFGLFFFMAFGVGSIMGWIAGYVGERIDLSTIFTVLAACTLVSALLGIGLVTITSRKTPKD